MRIGLGLSRLGATMAILLTVCAGLHAAEVIGSADTIANRVTGEIASRKRVLAESDAVHRDEIVQTERAASARILFRDASDLRLGANALDGAAQVCTRGGRCSLLANRCSYVAVDRAGVSAPQPLRTGIPSFASVCRGAACGADACGVSAAPSPAPSPLGYDPAGGRSDGSGSGGSGKR